MLDILVIKTIKICSLQVYILKTITLYTAARMTFESIDWKAEEAVIGKNGGRSSNHCPPVKQCLTNKQTKLESIF